MYSPDETERTYSAAAGLARASVTAGYPTVVDGMFLLRRQRARFRALAADLDVPFVIVDFAAPLETLRERVERRRQAGLDASEAELRVLEHQLQVAEPITADERAMTVRYEAEAPLERSRQVESWQPVLDRLHREAAVTH